MLEKNNNDMIQDAVYTPAEIDDTDAAAKMEQALYVHSEPQKKKKEKRRHSNFKAIVATGLI